MTDLWRPKFPRCPRCGALLDGRWDGDELHEHCPRCDWRRSRTLPAICEILNIYRAERLFPASHKGREG